MHRKRRKKVRNQPEINPRTIALQLRVLDGIGKSPNYEYQIVLNRKVKEIGTFLLEFLEK